MKYVHSNKFDPIRIDYQRAIAGMITQMHKWMHATKPMIERGMASNLLEQLLTSSSHSTHTFGGGECFDSL